MDLPVAVSKILRRLQNSGYAAYVVGGSVRDYFLGRKQQDYDIATSATPEQVMELFQKTIPTGLKHGTVTVIEDGVHCEVTTFRVDFDYDGRRPAYVKYSSKIEEDLQRRDFTINAIAYDGEHFCDPLGGISDIQCGIIRAVGDANQRFQEDYLRMLRAVRFAAQLGFTIEEQTQQAIREQAEKIVYVSMERVREELTKILLSNDPTIGITYMDELQLLKPILPELSVLDEEKYRQTLQLLRYTKGRLINRLCALFFFADDVKLSLKRLKYDRKTIQNVSAILQKRDTKNVQWTKYRIKKLIQDMGYDGVETFIELQEILVLNDADSTKMYEKAKHILQEIKNNNEPIFLQDLAIDGSDLIALGYPAGKVIGDVLHQLLEIVLDKPERNQKEWLLQYARKIKNRE